MILSQLLSGSIMFLAGLSLIVLGFFNLVTLIYGIPLFLLGVFILLNKNEDFIEKIKKGGTRK